MTSLTAFGTSRVLPVPYYVQPTSNTCQSTCLRMFAQYLEQSVLFQSTGAGERDIQHIWKDINTGTKRPSQVRNSHSNFKWWLEKHFPRITFDYLVLKDPVSVPEKIVSFINGGMPVLMSVSHARVPGHIVLVIGYEHYQPHQSSPDFRLVVHDPYGRFDPTLLSTLYGGRRYEGGMSLRSGGESGPGSNCRLMLDSVSRQRAGDVQRGTFYLLSARR